MPPRVVLRGPEGLTAPTTAFVPMLATTRHVSVVGDPKRLTEVQLEGRVNRTAG